MSRVSGVSWLLLLGALNGCGGGAPTNDSAAGAPHQGNLIRIPGGQGSVEVVTKPPGNSGTSVAGEVRFYFLKDDGTTPYSPAPTAGTLTVGSKKVVLEPEGDALVTPAGPPLFPKGGVDGVLNVELGGKSINVPLGVR